MNLLIIIMQTKRRKIKLLVLYLLLALISCTVSKDEVITSEKELLIPCIGLQFETPEFLTTPTFELGNRPQYSIIDFCNESENINQAYFQSSERIFDSLINLNNDTMILYMNFYRKFITKEVWLELSLNQRRCFNNYDTIGTVGNVDNVLVNFLDKQVNIFVAQNNFANSDRFIFDFVMYEPVDQNIYLKLEFQVLSSNSDVGFQIKRFNNITSSFSLKKE